MPEDRAFKAHAISERPIVTDLSTARQPTRAFRPLPGKRYPIEELISPSNTYAAEFEAALQKLVDVDKVRKVETGVYTKPR
jgi:hypothetical protein